MHQSASPENKPDGVTEVLGCLDLPPTNRADTKAPKIPAHKYLVTAQSHTGP